MTADSDTDIEWDSIEGEWKLKMLDDKFMLMHEKMDEPVKLNGAEVNDLEEVLAEVYIHSPVRYNYDL